MQPNLIGVVSNGEEINDFELGLFCQKEGLSTSEKRDKKLCLLHYRKYGEF